MGGNGKLQVLCDLNPNIQYHVTTRAITGAGNILEAPSDGISLDITPPLTNFTSFMGIDTTETKHNADTIFTRSIDPYTASWSIIEPQSIITSTNIWLGSFPGGSNILPQTNMTSLTAIPNGLLHPTVPTGTPVIITLQGENIVNILYFIFS